MAKERSSGHVEQAANHVEAARSGIGTGAIFGGAQRQSLAATTVVKGSGSAATMGGRSGGKNLKMLYSLLLKDISSKHLFYS